MEAGAMGTAEREILDNGNRRVGGSEGHFDRSRAGSFLREGRPVSEQNSARARRQGVRSRRARRCRLDDPNTAAWSRRSARISPRKPLPPILPTRCKPTTDRYPTAVLYRTRGQ
jgi:hypothetical protein